VHSGQVVVIAAEGYRKPFIDYNTPLSKLTDLVVNFLSLVSSDTD
jgi:hypothetical protein